MSEQGKGRTERVFGPYKHGQRWRVVIAAASGERSYARERDDGPEGFASEKAAREFIAGFLEEANGRTIGTAVTAYLDHFARYGNRNKPPREVSVVTARHKLTAFLQLPHADRPLRTLNAKYATKLYDGRVAAGVAVDTHRGELALARTFTGWCVKQGWLKADPFKDVKPEGERSAGKLTLSMDDAEKYLLTCLEEGSKEGLAGAALFELGLRVSELVNRVVGDLDERGTVLVIPRAKNRKSVRRVKIPVELQAGFADLVKGKARGESMFGMSRYAMYHHVQRLCRKARVPEVCCHALRGTGSTTAADLGVSLDAIQRAIGHAVGSKVTEKAYLAPGTLGNARTARLERSLQPSTTPMPSVGTIVVEEFPGNPNGPHEAQAEELN